MTTAPTPTGSSTSGHVWHAGRLIPVTLADHRDAAVARPAILVVVPYYNAAPWIADCLAALAANEEPHDVLVVDDGSDPAFVPAAGMRNLVHARFHRNAGLITALNFAAAFAAERGYLYYVRQDADDLSRPDRLRRQREAIERAGADMAVCGVRAVDEGGETLWIARADMDEAAFRRCLDSRNPAVHSTWFLRTDLFKRAGCYDERFKGAEDFELLQRIARVGRIAIVPEPLVDYLVRAGSVLSASRGPALQTVRIVARGFRPARPASYAALARAVAAALAPRGLKTAARRLLAGRRG